MKSRYLLAFTLFCSSCMVPNNRDHEERLDIQEESWEVARSDLDFVKHEQTNVASDLRLFERKLSTHESLIHATRRELSDAQARDHELLSSSLSDFEARMAALESTQEAMVQDLRDLKTHANDMGASLGQAKQRMGTLERSLDAQTETVRNLEGAVRALMALVEASDGAPASSFARGAKVYKVRSGDTLEKIAHREGISVRAIKQANGLKGDLIRVGQNLQIPK